MLILDELSASDPRIDPRKICAVGALVDDLDNKFG